MARLEKAISPQRHLSLVRATRRTTIRDTGVIDEFRLESGQRPVSFSSLSLCLCGDNQLSVQRSFAPAELWPRVKSVKSARKRMMIVYFKGVLRRHLFWLLLVATLAYTSMSSFGIAQDQTAAVVDTPADQTAPLADDSNPYSAISRANVFHLTEPPKPAERPDQALLNLPKVNISGFVRRSDRTCSCFVCNGVPKRPHELARYFNLAEGEKEDIPVQVTKIYPNQGSG